ncbi:hypothetical protein QCM80_38795, partial [Bradyrhizobium sp. SSUT112]|uniref:hypothetical protein n=1 Tax=Bradyrhizobium sp. SSUT112 TaxID=3040604 RepID=UPI00244A4106
RPVCGSGVLVCSSSLLIRRHQRARCQAETPLTDLFKFAEPALLFACFGLNARKLSSAAPMKFEDAQILRE